MSSATAPTNDLDRRTLLRAAIAIVVAPPPAEFRSLKAPVGVPLEQLGEPWSAVRFRALCPLAAPPPGAPRDRLLRGIAIRVPALDVEPSRLETLCLTCPHEICEVNLRTDATNVRMEDDGPAPDHPVFVCSCHFSVFDPAREGERLAGPAPRGLYRFRSRVEGDRLMVVEVEAAALR